MTLLGFSPAGALAIFCVALAICTTVCALGMEAAVLFTPAFLFLLPRTVDGFPRLATNEAIGLALVIEFFGYSSSCAGYWLRRRIDFRVVARALPWTIPAAMAARLASFLVPGALLMAVFALLLFALAVLVHRNHARIVGAAVTGRGLAPFEMGRRDRIILAAGGTLGGLAGIAIGEITQSWLLVRKRMPLRRATGTTALVLHATVLSALAVHLGVLWLRPAALHAETIHIPWRVAFVIVPAVLLGGQLGSWLSGRVEPRAQVRSMVAAYSLVAMVALANVAG